MKLWKVILSGLIFAALAMLFLQLNSVGPTPYNNAGHGTYLHYFDTEGNELWGKNYPEECLDRDRIPGRFYLNGLLSTSFLPDSSVVVTLSQKGLTCIEINGDERWSYQPAIPKGIFEYLFHSNGLVFCKVSNDEKTEIHAIAESGELAWVYNLGEKENLDAYDPRAYICVSGDYVFAAYQRLLHCIDFSGEGKAVFKIPEHAHVWRSNCDRYLVPSVPGQIVMLRNRTLYSMGKTGILWTFTLPHKPGRNKNTSSVEFASVGDSVFLINADPLDSFRSKILTLIHIDNSGNEVSRKTVPGKSVFLKNNFTNKLYLLEVDPLSLSQLDSQGGTEHIYPPKSADEPGLDLETPQKTRKQNWTTDPENLYIFSGQPMLIETNQGLLEPVRADLTQGEPGQEALRQGTFPDYYLNAMKLQRGEEWSINQEHEFSSWLSGSSFAPNGYLLLSGFVEEGGKR